MKSICRGSGDESGEVAGCVCLKFSGDVMCSRNLKDRSHSVPVLLSTEI